MLVDGKSLCSATSTLKDLKIGPIAFILVQPALHKANEHMQTCTLTTLKPSPQFLEHTEIQELAAMSR